MIKKTSDLLFQVVANIMISLGPAFVIERVYFFGAEEPEEVDHVYDTWHCHSDDLLCHVLLRTQCRVWAQKVSHFYDKRCLQTIGKSRPCL